MASNLETIGLGVDTREGFEKLVQRLAETAREGLKTPVGDYAIWRSRSGAEVWLHIATPGGDDDERVREIRGLTPFFDGTSDIELTVAALVKRPDDNDFEGAFQAWVGPGPGGEAEADSAYPLVFDAVDFALFATEDLPLKARVRIVGFCRSLTAYADEGSFLAAQAAGGPGFAPQSFLAVGLYAEAEATDGSVKAPSSNALINGVVKSHRELANEVSGQAFHWIEVESHAAIYDVVAAPGVVKGEIVVGGVVQAACWLFGRRLGGGAHPASG